MRASLNALQQLRNSLGAIHALRPEISKPLDQALVAKSARINHSTAALGAGLPGGCDARPPPVDVGSSAMMGAGMGGMGMGGMTPHHMDGATPQQMMMGGLGGEQKQKVESFMHRIAATAGALIVGVDPFAVAHMVRSTPHDPFGPDRRNPAQGGSTVPLIDAMPPTPSPLYVSSPDWSQSYSRPSKNKMRSPQLQPITPSRTRIRPSTPTGLSASASLSTIGPAVLRVPQPASAGRGIIPSASAGILNFRRTAEENRDNTSPISSPNTDRPSSAARKILM